MKDADYYLCPECNAEVSVGSQGCQACGPRKIAKKMKLKKRKKIARERKSWEQGSSYDGLDLPDDDFDYEDYVEREFGKKPHRKIGIAWYWWLTALILFLWMLFSLPL